MYTGHWRMAHHGYWTIILPPYTRLRSAIYCISNNDVYTCTCTCMYTVHVCTVHCMTAHDCIQWNPFTVDTTGTA